MVSPTDVVRLRFPNSIETSVKPPDIPGQFTRPPRVAVGDPVAVRPQRWDRRSSVPGTVVGPGADYAGELAVI